MGVNRQDVRAAVGQQVLLRLKRSPDTPMLRTSVLASLCPREHDNGLQRVARERWQAFSEKPS